MQIHCDYTVTIGARSHDQPAVINYLVKIQALHHIPHQREILYFQKLGSNQQNPYLCSALSTGGLST